jgi:hypothetical protein
MASSISHKFNFHVIQFLLHGNYFHAIFHVSHENKLHAKCPSVPNFPYNFFSIEAEIWLLQGME